MNFLAEKQSRWLVSASQTNLVLLADMYPVGGAPAAPMGGPYAPGAALYSNPPPGDGVDHSNPQPWFAGVLPSDLIVPGGPGACSMAQQQPSESECWALFAKCDGAPCEADFTVGRAHFKNKFCDECRTHGFKVAADRCRGVPADARMGNERSVGFWNQPNAVVNGRYRMINQTAACAPPKLVILENPATETALPPVPAYFVGADGYVWLRVSKGTLAPYDHRLGEAPDRPPAPSSSSRASLKRPLPSAGQPAATDACATG